MLEQIKCCHLECNERAEWAIYDEDAPVDNDTYSCSRHISELLSDQNYVAQLRREA